MKAVFLLALVLVVCGAACGQSIGPQLYRTFVVFREMPMNMSAAQSAGWKAVGSGCGPYGIEMSPVSDGPNADNSVTLFYAASGALAGFANTVWSEQPAALAEWWVPTSGSAAQLVVSTRDLSQVCNASAEFAYGLGDRVVVNGAKEVPLNATEAVAQGWTRGDCIPGMGVHYSYDLKTAPKMSWDPANLFPIMPMYNPNPGSGGPINAVLFITPTVQRFTPIGDWDAVFPKSLICKNWCADGGCSFPLTTFWSTMHFMFHDHNLNTCDGAKCVIHF